MEMIGGCMSASKAKIKGKDAKHSVQDVLQSMLCKLWCVVRSLFFEKSACPDGSLISFMVYNLSLPTFVRRDFEDSDC